MIWDLDIRANLLIWNRSLELNNHFSGALSYLEKLTPANWFPSYYIYTYIYKQDLFPRNKMEKAIPNPKLFIFRKLLH